MLTIQKMISNSVIDYAAEELKKYLRMMMPEGGDINIVYNPDAESGFRLGLMEMFDLDMSDVDDKDLDDILYIDCDTSGGIIAGSNSRSVLLSVYEYLRQNGCRWLMPGIDGEYIPIKDIIPVKYRHVPSMRHRGWCNEGAEFQQCMIDAIEFMPKVGLNTFMIEFVIPVGYYSGYYMHRRNAENFPPEPISTNVMLQYKRQCESELAKRGLQFHDIGHGWTTDPFNISSSLRQTDGDNEKAVPDESRQFIALVNGERKLIDNSPIYTNFCMSNEQARRMFVRYVADYAEKHSNSDYLHVWLADSGNTHCECEECKKKTPSDFYVILLNMIDEELEIRGLKTRIAFIVYTDTTWAPISEKIKNQDRFSLLLAPITRKYTETVNKVDKSIKTNPYVRNKTELPKNLDEYLAYFYDWKENWSGRSISYEYHFWKHQCLELTGIELSKRINEDVKAYYELGLDGIIEDGSQRSFFPTGLAFYTYARTMFDTSLSSESIAKEYFHCAFGDGSDRFYDYLSRLADAFGFEYMEGESNKDMGFTYYNPEHVSSLKKVREITAYGRKLIKEYYNMPHRLGTVSVRLLEHHADFCDMLSDALIEKASGNEEEASRLHTLLRIEFGKREPMIRSYYDQCLFFNAYETLFSTTLNKIRGCEINDGGN